MQNRVIGEKLAIDNAGVKEFFDKRPQKKLPYYRSIAEYREYMQQIFTSGGYSLLHSGDMWEENAKNRRETTAYFWIIEKIK